MTRIHFKNGLPSTQKIKLNFYNKTGLRLQFVAELNLSRLISDNKEIVNQLSADAEKYEEFKNQSLHVSEIDREKINHISYFEIRVNKFHPVEFSVKENMISLVYGIGQDYFPTSLIRALIDLGGEFVDWGDTQIDKEAKRWKKLRRWEDYSWYNRPKK